MNASLDQGASRESSLCSEVSLLSYNSQIDLYVLPASNFMLVLLRKVPQTVPKNITFLHNSTQRPSRRLLVHRRQPTLQSGKTVNSLSSHFEILPAARS